MKDNQEIVINEDDDCAPPKKKLKQARLPFQVLSPVAKPVLDTGTNKKRKLSEEGDVKVAKIVKCDESITSVEAKENVCSPVICEKNESIIKSGKIVKESECSEALSVKDNENNVQHLVKTSDNQNSDNSNAKNKNEGSEIAQSCEDVKSDTENGQSHMPEDELPNDISSDSDESSDEDSVKQSSSSESVANSVDPDEASDSSKVTLANGQEHSDFKNEDNKKGNGTKSESSENCENGELKLKDEYVTPVKPGKVDSDLRKATRSTDKRSGKQLFTPKEATPKTSPEITPKSKKLTPKQLQKQMESAKKKEEKERQRMEKEKKKAEEKEEKQRQKIEKEEQKKKEKEEKEEQKKKEKEEKERKRLAELEVKLEEKKQKEEEKRKKEEQRLLEKKKKDEKKQAEEDAKRKVAAAFTSYFLPKKSDSKFVEEVKDKPSETFMPFEVKSDMRLAPLCRLKFEDEQRNNLDKLLCEQNQSCNYLNDLRNKVVEPKKSLSTWPVSEKSDVIVIDDPEDEIVGVADNQVVELHPDINLPRPKLLQFWDNRRPPYWGTWRKKSSVITQKKPFGKDEKIFDYEVDSDDEWEEEEPGESLHGSDDEKESEDEYEVDNDFFVPHGYLSDEENVHGDDEENEIMSPESQRAKLKMLEHEFEEEMKQKTERLKPKVIGCVWRYKMNDAAGSQLLKLLSSRCAVYRDGPIVTSKPDDSPKSGSPAHDSDPIARRPKKRRFPESAVPALIRLIHGNSNGIIFLVKEFVTYYRKLLSETNKDEDKVSEKSEIDIPLPISKNGTSKKIRELASWTTCPDEGPLFGRNCWYVPLETRASFGLSDLEAGNKQWEYNLKPKRREIVMEVSPASSPVSVVTEPKPSMSITKFTKKLSREECQRQLRQDEQPQSETKPSVETKPCVGIKTFFAKSTEPSPTQKKRVPILASTARGQKLPEAREIIKMKTPNKNVDLCNTISKCKKAVTETNQNSVDIQSKGGEHPDSGAINPKLPDKEKANNTSANQEIVCIDLDD